LTSEKYYEDGEIYYYNGNFESALSSFQKYFEICGDNDSLNYIGCCHLQLNEFDYAKSIFEELIIEYPNWARPVFNLGRVYLKLGNYSEALEYFNKSLGIDPNEEEVYFYIGVYYYNINDFENAINYYRKSLSLNSLQPEVHLNLGICYSKLGMHIQAIEELDVAYNQDDEYVDALFNKAMVHIAMKEYTKAIDIFLKLYSSQPDNIENMIDILNCYLRIDDLNSADKWIKEILIKDSDNQVVNKLLKVLSVKRRIESSNVQENSTQTK
jgi:tetratricopeptide (TPR) repeat protein